MSSLKQRPETEGATLSWSAALVATLVLLAPAIAFAQPEAYPSRTVTLLVPAPAGGSADYFARQLAPKIAAAIKQNVIVENKPGATGVIGARAVITSPPDGHVLLLNSIASVVVGPHLSKPAAYDAIQDLTPITPIANAPAILVVRPELGIRTFPELIAYAKANPGKVNAASSGAGTLSSLNVAMLQKEAGIQITHVPYKGSPQAITDLLGGHVDIMFSDVSFFLNHLKAGKLIALAAAAPNRIPTLSEVPTTKEVGYPKLVAANVYCIFGPPKMAPELSARINTIFREAIADPDVAKSFLTQNATAEGMPTPEFAALFKTEEARFMSLVEDVGTEAAK